MGTVKAQLLIKQPKAVQVLHLPVLGAALSPLSPGLGGGWSHLSLALFFNSLLLALGLVKVVEMSEGTQFSGHEPAVSPFAWQSDRAILFYLTPPPRKKKKCQRWRLGKAETAPPPL